MYLCQKHKSLKISSHIQVFYMSPFWLKQSEKKPIQGWLFLTCGNFSWAFDTFIYFEFLSPGYYDCWFFKFQLQPLLSWDMLASEPCPSAEFHWIWPLEELSIACCYHGPRTLPLLAYISKIQNIILRLKNVFIKWIQYAKKKFINQLSSITETPPGVGSDIRKWVTEMF